MPWTCAKIVGLNYLQSTLSYVMVHMLHHAIVVQAGNKLHT